MGRLTIEEIRKMDKNFLSAAEAASAMGISKVTFYKHIEEMKFPVERIGSKYAIPKEQFLGFLSAEKNPQITKKEEKKDEKPKPLSSADETKKRRKVW